ncbi:hypothetical protein F0245_05870 [Vibrio chagasii]|uniref:Uncharacterized protein n=2 Tax=Vibrio chagasii TaxID=170679 RepID=A0A7Y3YMD8_9VIBR|nr:hypothetical protein [Vibrio chagasii]
MNGVEDEGSSTENAQVRSEVKIFYDEFNAALALIVITLTIEKLFLMCKRAGKSSKFEMTVSNVNTAQP